MPSFHQVKDKRTLTIAAYSIQMYKLECEITKMKYFGLQINKRFDDEYISLCHSGSVVRQNLSGINIPAKQFSAAYLFVKHRF